MVCASIVTNMLGVVRAVKRVRNKRLRAYRMCCVHTAPCLLLFRLQVQDQADGAWSYIVERRIEAPNKFAAVQTHRQVIELLAQQKQFVRELNEGE